MMYGKVHRLGSKEHAGFDEDAEIIVQEKMDGSQFSFWVEDGQLVCCSRTSRLDINEPGAMFAKAVATARLAHRNGLLEGGEVFYGEAFQRRRHNVLEYGVEPLGGLVLFEVSRSTKTIEEHAKEMGCTPVKELYRGPLLPKDELRAMATGISPTLGGRREGVVVKQLAPTYSRCKIVSPEFAEVKVVKSTKSDNPVADIGRAFAQPARYQKALQRLTEQGRITGTERDIGALIGEVRRDMFEEEKDAIAGALFALFSKDVGRAAVANVADWYKGVLDAGGQP